MGHHHTADKKVDGTVCDAVLEIQTVLEEDLLFFSFISWAQISVTANAGSPAKAALGGQGYVSEPGLAVMLLVQADLKSPAPLGKQGGRSRPMPTRAVLVSAACKHLQHSSLHPPRWPRSRTI